MITGTKHFDEQKFVGSLIKQHASLYFVVSVEFVYNDCYKITFFNVYAKSHTIATYSDSDLKYFKSLELKID